MSAAEFATKFAIENALTLESTPAGLVRAVVSTPLAEADAYLQGAHVAHWTPRGERPVLFVSSRSLYAPGKAIRGGVPVIFPWFGGRSDGQPGPAHGFARSLPWDLESTRLAPGGEVELVLSLQPSATSIGFGFETFAAQFRVLVGSELRMELEVRNTGSAPLTYEEALHSYFAVADIHRTSVSGLEGTTLIDKTDRFTRKQQPQAPVTIAKETDQVHVNTTAACVVHDPVWNRRIEVEKEGSQTTIVWNPWIEKTAGMSDMAPDEWKQMICVESGNAADNAVTLGPGETHVLTTVIRLAK